MIIWNDEAYEYNVVETTTIHEGFASEVGFSQGPEQYCQEELYHGTIFD